MAYLWLNISGLDPFRGLTQRIAILVVLGWYSFASYHLLRAIGSSEGAAPKDVLYAEPLASRG